MPVRATGVPTARTESVGGSDSDPVCETWSMTAGTAAEPRCCEESPIAPDAAVGRFAVAPFLLRENSPMAVIIANSSTMASATTTVDPSLASTWTVKLRMTDSLLGFSQRKRYVSPFETVIEAESEVPLKLYRAVPGSRTRVMEKTKGEDDCHSHLSLLPPLASLLSTLMSCACTVAPSADTLWRTVGIRATHVRTIVRTRNAPADLPVLIEVAIMSCSTSGSGAG